MDDKLQVKVQIDLTLESENGEFKLYLQTLGVFKLNKPDDMSDELADDILKKNTVAIMFPFIRSQVSLLTTQPGMSPILLQPIDVNALLHKEE
ncbi:MAG: protein-export chaperone SecB [Clostridia bacterium]|nr:protein-export chaperone SecB [Clostridia bacterium]